MGNEERTPLPAVEAAHGRPRSRIPVILFCELDDGPPSHPDQGAER